MKIAIPVDEKNINTNVSEHFGRAPYFLIYNIDNDEQIFVDNVGAVSTGGAGIKAAQTLIDNDIKGLLTPQCGENAAEVLKTADIKIYKTTSLSVKDNINHFKSDELPLLEEIHSGYHNHNGGK